MMIANASGTPLSFQRRAWRPLNHALRKLRDVPLVTGGTTP